MEVLVPAEKFHKESPIASSEYQVDEKVCILQ